MPPWGTTPPPGRKVDAHGTLFWERKKRCLKEETASVYA